MSLESLLVIGFVGLVAGWLAGLVMPGRRLGLLGSLVVGVLGAFIGAWLMRMLNVNIAGGIVGSIINAFLGAVLLLALIALLRRR